MNHSLWIIAILVLCVVLCIPSSAEETAPPKAVVLDLSMNGDAVHVTGSRVVMNYPPDNRATDRIVIRMLDKNGALLQQQGMDDPRVAYVEQGVVIRDSVNFSAIVPFRKDLATIRLVNGTTGAEIVSADVAAPVDTYCRAHGSDPDCAAGISPLLIGGVIVLALLILGGWWFLQHRKEGITGQKPAGP